MKKIKSQAAAIRESIKEMWPFPTGPKPGTSDIDEDPLRKYMDQTLDGEGELPIPIEGKDLPAITGIYNGGMLTGGLMNPDYQEAKMPPVTPYKFNPEAWARVLEADPQGKKLNEPGAKADAGKIRPWLMMSGFARALEEVSKVTTEGAAKYTDNGWVTVPNAQERYLDAFGRHLLKYGKGEVYDFGEGGIGTHHMAQMIWNLLAVLELQLRKDE